MVQEYVYLVEYIYKMRVTASQLKEEIFIYIFYILNNMMMRQWDLDLLCLF